MPRQRGEKDRTDAEDDSSRWQSWEKNKIKIGYHDADGHPLSLDARIRYHSSKGTVMRGKVAEGINVGRLVKIQIDGDPFPSMVDHRQIEIAAANEPFTPRRNVHMPTKKTSVRELRNKAKALSVTGWEEMSREEMEAAISEAEGTETPAPAKTKTSKSKATKSAKTVEKPAPKAKATKTAVKTKTTEKAAPKPRKAAAKPEGPNPFQPGTNLYFITEALMQGGKRSVLVKKLLPKLKYNPRVKAAEDFDPVAETDRRLKVVGYILKNQHGFSYSNEGRGADSVIKVTPPGADANGTKVAKGTKATVKAAPKKTTAKTAKSRKAK